MVLLWVGALNCWCIPGELSDTEKPLVGSSSHPFYSQSLPLDFLRYPIPLGVRRIGNEFFPVQGGTRCPENWRDCAFCFPQWQMEGILRIWSGTFVGSFFPRANYGGVTNLLIMLTGLFPSCQAACLSKSHQLEIEKKVLLSIVHSRCILFLVPRWCHRTTTCMRPGFRRCGN